MKDLKLKKITQLFLIGFLLLNSYSLSAQYLKWVKSIEGIKVTSSAVDGDGNLYIAGLFYTTVDMDPGPGIVNLKETYGDFNGDVFICKIDASGNFAWAKSEGGPYKDFNATVEADKNGNVWFAYTHVILESPELREITIINYNSNGQESWSKSVRPEPDYSFIETQAMATDGNGNMYLTGRFEGRINFKGGIQGGPYDVTSPAGTDADVFIAKFNSSGFLWAKALIGNMVYVYNIAADQSGNVYTTGGYYVSLDCDPGPGNATLTSSGSHDIFVSKLDKNGNYQWAKSMGGATSMDEGLAIAADNSGNVYTIGHFSDPADFDPGPGIFKLTPVYEVVDNYDIFISKLSPSGKFVWAKQIGSNLDDDGGGISVDNAGNVYTTGYFQSTADFDPGIATLNLTAVGDKEAFIQKLDSSGSLLWAKKIGAENTDFGSFLKLDKFNNIYTVGEFIGTVDFDPGNGVYNLTAPRSSFLLKLSESASGLMEQKDEESFIIYPNPAYDQIFISSRVSVDTYITNAYGKEIWSGKIKSGEPLNISGFVPGLYFVRIPGRNINYKLLKL